MGKRKKKEAANNAGGQIVSMIQQSLKAQQQKRPITRPSQVLHENPYKGAKLYGYRQTISANAYHWRRTAQKINLIESITRHLTTRTRAYLTVSEAETEAGFQIKHKDAEREIGTREREEIKQIEQFFLNCGIQPRLSNDNLMSYTAKLIRDYHSMDHFTGQVLYNPFGDIVGFCSVDSASIVPLQSPTILAMLFRP